jgi:hypothetical protein
VISAPRTTTALEIVPKAITGPSLPNLPGFCPAVYPTRLTARLDCLSWTRHPLQQQAGTLDAHFLSLAHSAIASAVPMAGRAKQLPRSPQENNMLRRQRGSEVLMDCGRVRPNMGPFKFVASVLTTSAHSLEP